MKGEAIANLVNRSARQSFQATVSVRNLNLLNATAAGLDIPRRTLVEFLIMQIPELIRSGVIEKYEEWDKNL